MRKKISVKLFVLLAVILSVLFGGLLFFQSVFFDQFYLNQKRAHLHKALIELSKTIQSAEDPFSEEMSKNLMAFYKKRLISISYIQMLAQAKETENQASLSIHIGILHQDDLHDILIEEALNGFNKEQSYFLEGGTRVFSREDANANMYLIGITGVDNGDDNAGLLMLYTSLQPVGEAVVAMQRYYLLFFLIALIFIFGFSFVFSRTITKPLLHINAVANRIARQDFSHRCVIESDDEIGDLSASINALSDNLSAKIFELKQEIEKQKALEENRLLFVAGVSHELKTPVSIIQGYAEGLMDPDKASVNLKYASVIQDEAEKIGQIVSDLLDIAQMESGQYRLKHSSFSLVRLIKYHIQRFQDAANEKNLLVLFDHNAEESYMVNADMKRIDHVVSNLLLNAIRYSPVGSRIGISLSYQGEKIVTQIDNSCSLEHQRELEQMWEVFYRLDQSRNKSTGGTGIGLTVVKNILTLHESEFGNYLEDNHIVFFFTLDRSD